MGAMLVVPIHDVCVSFADQDNIVLKQLCVLEYMLLQVPREVLSVPTVWLLWALKCYRTGSLLLALTVFNGRGNCSLGARW